MSAFDPDDSSTIAFLGRNEDVPSRSSSLHSGHIQEALDCSFDAGLTLNFTKLNLSDVGVSAAEELATMGRQTPDDESIVERLALNYNRLTTLPTEFALLSRLRYLNLKHNSFSVFPDVLTLMASLDTLDISCNKIKRLPAQPGQLTNLRVLCLSRNKISRLPQYLTAFHKLEVLQVDRNPLEWPPRSVIENTGRTMEDWIKHLQNWMENDGSFGTRRREGSGQDENCDWEHILSEDQKAWRFPIQETEFDNGVTPHARNFSVDSNMSFSSVGGSFQAIETRTVKQASGRPPPLHLGMLQPTGSDGSPTRSLDSYLPSPTESDRDSFEVDNSLFRQIENYEPHQIQHSRTMSFADGSHSTRSASSSFAKKSLPDLRTTHLNIVKKFPDPSAVGSHMATSGSDEHNEDFNISDNVRSQETGLHSKPTAQSNIHESSAKPNHSIASERNSYFRRLSTLPLSKTLPAPLQCLIECARSILFVMCQVYHAIEHYAIHAIDERLSSVLKKVIDPASIDMMQLIRSLDRFDNMSHKTVPSATVCRGLVESCRDTVAVFNKALGVLTLQLKVIATGDDVRYSRWILLELYAATAEISCAWQVILPHMESIRPFLRSKNFPTIPHPVESSVLGAPASQTQNESLQQQQQQQVLRNRSGDNLSIDSVPQQNGRARTARRHAGSFSSKDVEIGKQLPSFDNAPTLTGRITHTLRTPIRQTTVPLTLRTPASHFASSEDSSHIRHGSQNSIHLSSSTSSSPSLPSKHTLLELPINSKMQVDKEALYAVQDAVEVAPDVWRMIEESVFNEETKDDLQNLLLRAKQVTSRLSNMIKSMLEGDPTADRKTLREDAHVFLKVVVSLSNVIKSFGTIKPVPNELRTKMVKLTNSTEEFAILLHVSSFTPSTPGLYSPMINLSLVQSQPVDDNRLENNFTRSRSLHRNPLTKQTTNANFDGPRSALVSQNFKVPVIK